MQERSGDEEKAKKVCAEEIRKYAADFCQIVEDAKHDKRLSKDVRAYIEAVKFSCIGNLVWSIYCPRYRKF